MINGMLLSIVIMYQKIIQVILKQTRDKKKPLDRKNNI